MFRGNTIGWGEGGQKIDIRNLITLIQQKVSQFFLKYDNLKECCQYKQTEQSQYQNLNIPQVQ